MFFHFYFDDLSKNILKSVFEVLDKFLNKFIRPANPKSRQNVM